MVFDRHVNNELNALLEAKNALEVKIEDVKLNIIRKKIEKSEYFINFLKKTPKKIIGEVVENRKSIKNSKEIKN